MLHRILFLRIISDRKYSRYYTHIFLGGFMMNTKNVLAKLGMTVTVFLIAFSFTLFANEDSTTSSGETPDVIEGVEIDGDTSQTTDGAISIENPLPDFIKERFEMATKYSISPGKANLLTRLKATDLDDSIDLDEWAQKTIREIQKERIENKKKAQEELKANTSSNAKVKLEKPEKFAKPEKTGKPEKNNKVNNANKPNK